MTIEQTLQKEIQEPKIWLNVEKEDTTYKQDLKKTIELINWTLENMNDPNVQFSDKNLN